jgi:hypothetical protein
MCYELNKIDAISAKVLFFYLPFELHRFEREPFFTAKTQFPIASL